jgi:hypothetical protein
MTAMRLWADKWIFGEGNEPGRDSDVARNGGQMVSTLVRSLSGREFQRCHRYR